MLMGWVGNRPTDNMEILYVYFHFQNKETRPETVAWESSMNGTQQNYAV
jgi:hypothetical protein